MFRIHVDLQLRSDIDTVFDVLTDHAGYTRFRGIDAAELLEPGSDEPNGTDALRRIGAGPLQFVERITRFERPRLMHYRIERAKPFPMRHDLGEITLTAVDGGTRVVWNSEGHIRIPVLGHVMDRLLQDRIGRQFRSMLRHIDTA